MKKIEAICDSIAACHDYYEPESQAYELRNPGLLPDPKNSQAKRIFACHRGGYAALQDVVERHCKSAPERQLRELYEFLGIKMTQQQMKALAFLSRCMNSNVPRLTTPLGWFLEQ